MSSPSKMTIVQLKARAKQLGCKGYSGKNKDQLVIFIRNCKKVSPKKVSPKKSLSSLTVNELRLHAKKLGCKGYSKMLKKNLSLSFQIVKNNHQKRYHLLVNHPLLVKYLPLKIYDTSLSNV